MPLSEEAWRLAGGVAAHQLWTLVEDDGAPTDEPRVMALLMYVVGDEHKLARLVGTSNVEGAVATIIAEESPSCYALGVDARAGTAGSRTDALVVMVGEGDERAVISIPYRLPLRLEEPGGLPQGSASLEAFRAGLRSGGGWDRIRTRVGPLLGEPPDPAPTPTPIARRRQRRAELGDFRLRGGMLQRLRRDGEVRAEFPVDEIRIDIVRRRQGIAGLVLLGLAAGALVASFLCLGPWGLACAAVPAFLLVVVGVVAFLRASYLEIHHDEGVDRWMIPRSTPAEEAEAFVAAVSGRPPPALVPSGEIVAHLYLTQDPPAEIPDQFITYARHELIDDVEDRLLAPQGLIYAVAKQSGMNARLYGLLQHLVRTRWHIELRVAEAAVPTIIEWGQGIPFIAVLPDGTVTDNQLRSLLTLTGAATHPDAALPYPADAVARREVTRAELAAAGLRDAPVPPVIGEEEVVLRDASAVAERALVLALVVAPFAAGVTSGDELPPMGALTRRWGELMRALTPEERALLERRDPEAALQLAWRMEAAATLFWALGWLPGPLSMSEPIDAEPVLAAVERLGRPLSAAVEAAALRPTHEILDLLDRVYCRRWIAVDARIDDRPAPPGSNPSVLLERHHALNWLTHHNNERGVSWDEIETPT